MKYTQALLLGLLIWMPAMSQATNTPPASTADLADMIYQASEPFPGIETAKLDGLLNRIGDSPVVLIGDASHGTAEFYDMRARISRELIEKKGFNIIAIEGDWPDVFVIDHYIRGSGPAPTVSYQPFGEFPSWVWENRSVTRFADWLRDFNRQFDSADDAIGIYGIDLYNLYGAIEAVMQYLHALDPAMAAYIHSHYRCLMPWSDDPGEYSNFMQSRQDNGCAEPVGKAYTALRHMRPDYESLDRRRYFNALQNARLVQAAEFYFRVRQQGTHDSWNLRDHYMFNTLIRVMQHKGDTAKAVIWAHNSHVGDMRATELAGDGSINLGQLVREQFGQSAYLIGFGTDRGTVAAAASWGSPMEIMPVPPAHKKSYEYLFHQVQADNFMLPLRYSRNPKLIGQLSTPRLQRGIGATYNPDPEKEMKHHYAYASLPYQFDEFIWMDETQAVVP